MNECLNTSLNLSNIWLDFKQESKALGYKSQGTKVIQWKLFYLENETTLGYILVETYIDTWGY